MKRKPVMVSDERFGERLARLRQAAGLTQRQLAAELGISQRMIAYYESQSEHAPAHMLPVVAQLLGVSTDELLGLKPVKASAHLGQEPLWRRFRQIEKLPAKERRQLLAIVDTYLEKHRLAEQH